jgi:GNAT superfamily N-acetyltransferase
MSNSIATEDLPLLLDAADLESASDVMARAFFDDPPWVFLYPEPETRRRILARFFPALIAAGIVSRQIYRAGSPVSGVALWRFPGQHATRIDRTALWNLLRLAGTSFLLAAVRARGIFTQFYRMHGRYAPDPHYYLRTIGVAPEVQGQGLASRLIRPFLAQAEARGMAAYTETMTPANVSLYEHFGFHVMECYAVPDTDLRIWSFYRAPHTGR